MDAPHRSQAVPLAAARQAARLTFAPRVLALVLVAPQARLLRAAGHRQRLLAALHERGLATLDLDKPGQLAPALRWSAQRPELADLPLGLWLDGEGAQPALELAARQPARVRAVVVVNPQLGADGPPLAQVHAATLLIQLGAEPAPPLALRHLLAHLGGSRRLESVPLPPARAARAGAIEAVAQLASAWMATHLAHRRIL